MIVTLLFLQQRKDEKLTYMSAWMVLPMLSRHGTSCLSHLLAVSIFYTLKERLFGLLSVGVLQKLKTSILNETQKKQQNIIC